jgi:CRP-like cAMP-binding protein
MRRAGPQDGFWHLLTESEQNALSALGRSSVFRPGATMCVQGEPATHVFILLTGWVKILTVMRDGQELVLALRGDGDVVGELAGETSGYRTATIQTMGSVRSLIVGQDPFNAFLEAHPGADRAYRRAVTLRWNEAATTLLNRSITSGAQRLAALLLELAARHGTQAGSTIEVGMPLSQEELASLAGTSRATVTRALRDWRRRSLIRTSHRHVTIIDIAGLRKLASPVD